MGRWKQQDATVCIFGTVNCAFGENTSDARRIVNTHNADCDAYEARIAELEAELTGAYRGLHKAGTELLDARAELARVKAESLRVVEDPDSDEWVMTPDGLGWYGQDAIGNPKIETPHAYHNFEDCKKVRLERWEKEE